MPNLVYPVNLKNPEYYEFTLSSADFQAQSVPLIELSKTLVLVKAKMDKVNIHSRSGYGFLSAIEPHHFYIDLAIWEKLPLIIVKATYRGNATFSVSLLMLLLVCIPVVLVLITDQSENGALPIFVIMGPLTVLVFLFYYHCRRQQFKAKQEMEKIFAEMGFSPGR